MESAVATPELDPLGEVPEMRETKSLATKRLRFEGRYTKFETRLAAWRAKLKKVRGGSKSSVNDDAWAFALAEFPPCYVPIEEVERAKSAASVASGVPAVVPENGSPGEGELEPSGPAAVLGTGAASGGSAGEATGRGEIPPQPPAGLTVSDDDAARLAAAQTIGPFFPIPAPVESEPAAAVEVLTSTGRSTGGEGIPPKIVNQPEEPYEGPATQSVTYADLVRDTLWAYEHLSNDKIRSKNAPSRGAWTMLSFARHNRNEFMKNHLPRAMKEGDLDPESKAADKLDARQVEVIDGMLERVATECENGVKLYCPNCGERLRVNL